MKTCTRFLSFFAAAVLAAGGLFAANQIPEEVKQGGFAVGPQAYSFNKFTAFEAVEKAAEAGAKVIEFYPGQKLSVEKPDKKLHHTMSDEDFAELQAKLTKHGVKAVNYGVVGGKDEAEWKQIFEFAKKLGLYAVTTEDVKNVDIIEKMVKEYDIKAGYHQHAKRLDRAYQLWDPNFVLSLVKDRDPRLGACGDTGHWATSGLVPLDCLKILKGRIISTHLKDRTEIGRQAKDQIYGEGICDVPAMLAELKAQGFDGNVSVEYENKWEDNVGDIKKCIEFVKAWGEKNQ
ncbi:sugar phosphate isomerase/epimerase [Phragmitibacter flavus]|uniref:Sugar phosphate isomerase/epimerase n=1 Tax=Phragmitibacter flavus TaxID=2576071 RepID=A0A5R8KGZ8_9BACT|nr:sugar phosphate isomerase/epimerase [Phragmitibacter flavus]TLD71562.1 sugar phosphate isomerase/epimerase [Phragmitibacter flavus]